MEIRALNTIALRIEDHAERSKGDQAVVGVTVLVSAVYFMKQEFDTANFDDAVRLIKSDNGAHWCAIRMPKYQAQKNGK